MLMGYRDPVNDSLDMFSVCGSYAVWAGVQGTEAAKHAVNVRMRSSDMAAWNYCTISQSSADHGGAYVC